MLGGAKQQDSDSCLFETQCCHMRISTFLVQKVNKVSEDFLGQSSMCCYSRLFIESSLFGSFIRWRLLGAVFTRGGNRGHWTASKAFLVVQQSWVRIWIKLIVVDLLDIYYWSEYIK